MTDQYSHFIYVPASSRASRMIIEQSSYSTTPDLSPGNHTPLSGQATDEPKPSCREDVDALHSALEICANDVKDVVPVNLQNSGVECTSSFPSTQEPSAINTETVTTTNTITTKNVNVTEEKKSETKRRKAHQQKNPRGTQSKKVSTNGQFVID